jgi:serine protease inhibitor
MQYLLIFYIAFLFSGCIKDVKPWQKATHAKDTMKEGGLNKLTKSFEEHIYFSKEATKAGNGISGGGCGCN